MGTGSLRLRLALASSIAISLALALAGLAFYYQFQKHVSRLVLQEFDTHYQQLAASLSFDDNGKLLVESELTDPRFSQQFGGLYWQIDVPGQVPLRSRSLWDETLSVPTPPEGPEDEHTHDLEGPDGTTLIALERSLEIEKPGGGSVKTVVTIGMDKTKVSNAVTGFSNDMTAGLGLLYLALLGSAIAQIFVGLRPLEAIRKGLQAIRNGETARMEGRHPAEVQPLVAELNSLVVARDQQLSRARKRAGNLAHGLKTPLTVLEAIAGEIESRGQTRSAAEIRASISDMRTLIERELMRARTSAGNLHASTQVAPLAERLSKAMQVARGTGDLTWQISIAPAETLPMEAGDLMELLGNLFDNAQKHARSIVRIAARSNQLTVEDDGPGVDPEKFTAILQRGVKLDELKHGSGLGLAIVNDLAEAYGARLALANSPLGGLRVSVDFSK